MTDADVSRVRELPTSHSYSWCDRDSNKICVGYIWSIEKFRHLQEKTGKGIESSVFSGSDTDRNKWRLELFPKGSNSKNKTRVSLFLHHAPDDTSLSATVGFEFSILNNNGRKRSVKKVDSHTFMNKERVWGFSKYIDRTFLLESKNELLDRGVLTVQCEVTTLATKPEIINELSYSRFRLTEDLGHLLKNRRFTDVVLLAENKELPAHRAILAARSTVFATVFEAIADKNLKKVELTDITYSVLEHMVRFIYTGEAPTMDEGMAKNLLPAADKFDLEDLKMICERTLATGPLTSEKVAHLIPMANLHNAKYLKAQIVDFMKSHDTDDVVNHLLTKKVK